MGPSPLNNTCFLTTQRSQREREREREDREASQKKDRDRKHEWARGHFTGSHKEAVGRKQVESTCFSTRYHKQLPSTN